MKRLYMMLATAVVALAVSTGASAQYYQIANQLTNIISPALSGSFKYKGFVEMAGMAGIGGHRANFVDISTSQGFQYASWFFMGAGLGVDIVRGHSKDEGWADVPGRGVPGWSDHSVSTTKVMIPVFSDFRFNIGPASGTSFFIDLKVGASWLIGSSYLDTGNSRLTGDTQFYFRPSMGVRIPVNSSNSSQAVNIGVSYQLITSNNNYAYYYDNSLTLNSLGVSIAYEW